MNFREVAFDSKQDSDGKPWRKPYRIAVRRVRPGAGWYWRIKAANGKIVAHSETFATYGNARRAAKALIAAELVLEEDG